MNALVANAKSASALAVIRSLGKRGIEVTGASDNENDFPLFSKYCKDKISLTTNLNEVEGRAQELLEIVKNKHFDVFIPVMREDLLLAVSKRKEEFEKYTRLALSSFEQLSILNDKGSVSSLLSELEIPCPKTYIVDSEDTLDFIQKSASFPLLIKPFRGEGTEGIEVINNSEALSKFYNKYKEEGVPSMVQEFIHGSKYSAVFLLNSNYEVKRFFVHKVIREYPLAGGPACFLKSVKYEPIYEYGLKLLKGARYTGIAEMEFIVDEKDLQPKIIDVNPRFYGSLQCAVASGADFPYALFNLTLNGDIETDLSYKTGVTGRHLLFEDTKHLMSVLKGEKSPKHNLGKMATIVNYLTSFSANTDFVFSLSDIGPALKKMTLHI